MARSWRRANSLLLTGENGHLPACTGCCPEAGRVGGEKGGWEGYPGLWGLIFGVGLRQCGALPIPSPTSTCPAGSEQLLSVQAQWAGAQEKSNRGGGSCWLPSSSR